MKSIYKYCLYLIGLLCLVGCNNGEDANEDTETLFSILPPETSGVDFVNEVTETDSLNILDYLYFYNGGGLAVGDINNDGLPDLYFSANQGQNKLYLNKGNLKFEDISKTAMVSGNSSWNTGAVMIDINNDGWLDIYVSAVVGINGFEGHHELFINNQDNTFTEQSALYNLDLQTYGTTTAFLDFDLDGDLDLFVINHAVHTPESFGRAQIRKDRNDKTGDRLLRNDLGTFTDVSEEAGIFGGINGYGLGVSVADFNQDGYPDIYVGNDFHEDDYFYLNNGDGTFTESLKNYFGHTSRFSMGNDAADINNDGTPDLISLDMLPEDETVIKSSEGDDMYQTLQMRTKQYGYHYQYSRNMLYVSQPEHTYKETALLDGVAATDWSWSALFADYNLDGTLDLFISNGIPKRPNDKDYIRFISNEQINQQLNNSRLVDQQALEMMPSGKVPNYFFMGRPNLPFEDMTKQWSPNLPSISGASAIADLDNDGDLDIITNNSNEPATIYVNTSQEKHFVTIQFQYVNKNPFGIGTKVFCYYNNTMQYRELYTARGFQASSQPMIHFGLGDTKTIDSLRILWPNQTQQTLYHVSSDTLLKIKPENTIPHQYAQNPSKTLFKRVKTNLGIDYTHREDAHTDFNFQKLIPYETSDRGPALAIGDIDGDGKDDLFLGGAHQQKSALFLHKEKGFIKTSYPIIEKDSATEDVAAAFVNDQLWVASGGNVITPSKKVLQNRIYTSNSKLSSEETSLNTNVLKEHDGYIFVGNHSAPYDFGKITDSYIQFPNGDRQKISPKGMVTDALWNDFDQDGLTDLIIIGEWMSPLFLKNNQTRFDEVGLLNAPLNGLWQSMIAFDIDKDGDQDILLGNWGLNNKFKASNEAPMRMYYADFDKNSTTETIVTVEKEGNYFPLMGLDELAGQMVFLRKKFNAYKDFAGKTIEEIMGDQLSKASLFEVHTLASGYLINEGNSFQFKPFPNDLQISPIMAFTKFDFNQDGFEEVLAAGNYFGVIPFHGRYDSFSGSMIHDENHFTNASALGLRLMHKSVRHLQLLTFQNKPYLLIVYNNDKAEVYEINQ